MSGEEKRARKKKREKREVAKTTVSVVFGSLRMAGESLNDADADDDG